MMIKHALEVNDCFMQLAKIRRNLTWRTGVNHCCWCPVYDSPSIKGGLLGHTHATLLHIKSKLLSHMHVYVHVTKSKLAGTLHMKILLIKTREMISP